MRRAIPVGGRRWRAAGLAVTAAVVAVAGAPAAVAASPPAAADVVVDGHAFTPAEVHVANGGTVTFRVDQAGHTVVADDATFALRGPDGGTLEAGSNHSVLMEQPDAVVPYHCEIHPGMRGRIVVGRPTLGGGGSTIMVPEHASLADAVLLAEPGDTVDVAPGRHVLGSTLVVGGERVTVRGRTGVAGDVVLSAGERLLGTAVELSGRQVGLEDLTVVAGRSAGVRATPSGVGLHLRNVEVVAGPVSRGGIVAAGVNGLRLDHVTVRGIRGDAVAVTDCPACGLWVSDLHVSATTTGVRLAGVGGALVDGAVLDGPTDGVVLSGVSGTRVEGVTVSGAARYGIAVAGGLAIDTVVAGNDATGSAGPDLAWDGLGTRTCFAANGSHDTAPPTLTDTASCANGNPWSVPWPIPTIDQTRT